MSATRRNQAAWEKPAINLAGDLARAASLGVRSIRQVAQDTGLTIVTIMDCLYRQPVAELDNPRTYLCRPRYRIASTPLWSPDQVADAAQVTGRTGPPDDQFEAMRVNQAAWERTATNLVDDLARAAELDVQSIERVADVTGLTVVTINDALYRPVVTASTNPRTYLCRPAYRINSTPYWTHDQVSAAARVAGERRSKVGRGPQLPTVAEGADVVGIRDIAVAVGMHEQTVRKWTAGSYSTGRVETVEDSSVADPFPEPVGRRSQPPGLRRGNPETVYDRAAVHRWIRDEIGQDVGPLGDRAAADELRARVVALRQAKARGATEAVAR